MTAHLHFLDFAVLLVYLLAVTAMGLYFSRKNTSTEEYFLGGRRFSGWAIGLSMVGTAISSITFLAMPADAFKTTWIRYITYGGLPIAAIVAALWAVPIFRQQRVTSVYEYLEARFGSSVRVYGGITYVLAQLMRVSVVLYLLALLLHEISGLPIIPCVLCTALFVGFYTIVGGIDAVIWTDILQTVVLALGSVMGLWVIVQALPGGFAQIIDVGMAYHKFSFGDVVNGEIQPANWSLGFGEKSASMILMVGISFFLTEYLGSQHMIQRYCAARSTAEARKGLWVNVCLSLPVWTFYMLFGTALYVFFDAFPTVAAAEMLDGPRRAEQIVPYFILNHMPSGLAGLMLAAALAAGMSSLDSSINSLSTVAVVDIYRRHWRPGRTDRHYLSAARWIATLATVVMAAGACALASVNGSTLQDTAFVLTSLFTGGMLGLFVLGLFTTRGNTRSVWVGIVCTVLFTGWCLLQQRGLVPEMLRMPFDLYYTGLIGNVVMFVLGYALGLCWPATVSLDRLTAWTRREPS